MNDPILLTFPIPTPEEMADRLGVPRSRIKWLRSILREQGSLPSARRKSRAAAGHEIDIKAGSPLKVYVADDTPLPAAS